MTCWCPDECVCGAGEANDLLSEAEAAEGAELHREAETEAWLWLASEAA